MQKTYGELDVPYTVSDRRSMGIKQNFSFDGVLREDQQEALSALLEHNTGDLSAGTGFGKTVTATALIASRNTSSLILVHTHALLEQWKNAVLRFLKVEAGTIAAGKDKSTGVIDIALLQSLTDTDKETGETVVKPLPHEYGMVIVDECHHVSAFNFERVLKSIPARCVYGLTATPVRRDGHQPIIFMQCGPVRYATNMKSMTEQQNFYRHLIPRFTAFKPVGLGYTVKPQSEDADTSSSKPETQAGTFFSADDYRQPFLSDCTSSQRQVFISSPYLSKAVVQETLPFFQPLVGRGVQVSVMTKKAPTENTTAIDKNKALIKLLEIAGITVTQKEGLSQRIAVIDEQILWYGSANLLGYAEEDDCFMRICNQSVATAIMTELERD